MQLRAFLWRWCIYSPSEGEQKKREIDAPSEGGKGVWCWKMQQLAFSWRWCIYSPSEGE
ncbi:MAG TPA: hypothetical protein IAB85_07840 [Candidatus Coprenecus merdigallinarum]|nr:hypothetical protein [Candidatus Coprenecus merdigallinarum]